MGGTLFYQPYAAGATYVGYYEYESATIDGTFSHWWGTTETLRGSVFLPWPDNPLYTHPEWNALNSTSHGGDLTVVNGVVSDFYWTHESGGAYAQFALSWFSAIIYTDLWYFYPNLPPEEQHGLAIGGTLTFGAPARVDPNSVFVPYYWVSDGSPGLALPGFLLLLAMTENRLRRRRQPS